VPLLEPGSRRATIDDTALLAALVRTEAAWLQALAASGLLKHEQISSATLETIPVRLRDEDVEATGNPVPALVDQLRAGINDPDVASMLHVGLTSQDTLDTALMLIARDALDQVTSALAATAGALATLVDEHRGSVMAGRTLTQYAVPVTFGLKAAQWLVGVLDAADAVTAVRRSLPVQCGGAAGTLSRAADLVADPLQLVAAFAQELGLARPDLPWHTRRTPVLRLADALGETLAALGVLASDILLLGRPEIAEVREMPAEGTGRSSTLPHKQNPVLAVLVRSAALQGPQLVAQLHLSAALAVDERPDGAWHAEWPALRRLLTLAVVASSQAADLIPTLSVDTAAMSRRVEEAADELLAERRRDEPGPPSSYLGAADAFVEAALRRYFDTSGVER